MKHKNHGKEREHKAAVHSADSNGVEENELHGADPTHGEIAVLAYSLWTKRKPHECSAEEDWYRAEEQLRQSKQ